MYTRSTWWAILQPLLLAIVRKQRQAGYVRLVRSVHKVLGLLMLPHPVRHRGGRRRHLHWLLQFRPGRLKHLRRVRRGLLVLLLALLLLLVLLVLLLAVCSSRRVVSPSSLLLLALEGQRRRRGRDLVVLLTPLGLVRLPALRGRGRRGVLRRRELVLENSAAAAAACAIYGADREHRMRLVGSGPLASMP